jgi:glycosyltransferase involved in cell wall biosynthesis
MKIWIASAYDPIPGLDTDIRILRYGSLAMALLRQGHEVVFWTSSFAHWRKRHRVEGDVRRTVQPGFVAEYLHGRSYHRNVSLARVQHNRELARAFRRRAALWPERPDVIVAEIPCLELAAAAAEFAAAARIPMVCDIQDIWPDVYLSWLPRWSHRSARLLLRADYAKLGFILKHSTSVTAVSRAYLEWTRPHLPRPLDTRDAVFPLGYPAPSASVLAASENDTVVFRAKHRVQPTDVVITFLGQFATSYDVNTIVAAARLLEGEPDLPSFKVVLAGDGDKATKLHRAAQGLRSVVFTGWLDARDSVALLRTSDLALAAYAPLAAQSLPYKPFEYMAFGLPIINSLPGELGDLVTSQGLGANYRAGSAESLASALSRFLRDPAARAAAGRRSQEIHRTSFDANNLYLSMASHITSIASPVSYDR